MRPHPAAHPHKEVPPPPREFPAMFCQTLRLHHLRKGGTLGLPLSRILPKRYLLREGEKN